jgi:tRNA (cmo5U34)-methyltransferase
MLEQQVGTGDWGEENTRAFIDYGRYLVPDRDYQIETICDLIPGNGEAFHVIDLCCGEGLLSAAILDRFPACTVRALDGSPEMLAQARHALSRFGERLSADLFDLAAPEWRASPRPARAIVSSLAIHHLDHDQKQALYADVVRMLEPGGAFLVADLVRPTTRQGFAVAEKAWDDAVRRQSLALDGTARAFDFFVQEQWNYYRHPDPFDKPARLCDHLRWLERAGFADVDVYWLKAGHAIYGGRKPNGGRG